MTKSRRWLSLPRQALARTQWPGWLALWRVLPQWTRYHGAWGPGIYLLRNMSHRNKSVLTGSIISLLSFTVLWQLASARLDQLDQARRAVAGTEVVRRLSHLQITVLELGRALRQLEAGDAAPTADGLFRAEGEAYGYLLASLQGSLMAMPQLKQTVAEVQARRQAMLAHRAQGDQAAVRSASQPWTRSNRAYHDALQALHGEFVGDWAAASDLEPEVRLVREGLVLTASALGDRMFRLVEVQQRAFADTAQPLLRREADERLAEARTVLTMRRPMFDRARAVTPLRAAQIDQAYKAVERLVEMSAQIGRQATVVSSETSGSAGISLLNYRRAAQAAQEACRQLEVTGLDELAERLARREKELTRALLWQGLALTIALATTLYLLVCMYKVLNGGLRYLGAQVEQLGRGNLSIRPVGHGKDEIGQALTRLGQSAAQMSALFQAVTQGVASVSHASREVATGNAGLDGRTADIRQSIGQVADRTQAFTVAMDRCGESVERVSEHVRSMRVEAQRSRHATASLHERMRSLQGKSREITQVVGLVEAMAHQTKLLALNASVESARAGAAGKGFAVVAQEVRSLANRSEAAARRIREIADASVAEISEGSVAAERVSTAVGRTDEEIQSVNAIMGEIVATVRDGQGQSREVLNIARDVDDAADGTARIVGQLSLASAELRDQGDSLKRSIQHFVTA